MCAPAAPDPKVTAAAQQNMNINTAMAQQGMNMVNKVNPWGTETSVLSGTDRIKGADGKWIEVPRYTQTTTLSPAQAAIKKQTDKTMQNLAGVATERSAFLGDYLQGGIDSSGLPSLAGGDDFSADRQMYTDTVLERMSPSMAQDESRLRTQLINSGIRPGSAAWDSEWGRHQQGVNDARLGAILAGGQEQQRMATLNNATRAQGMQELYAERNQPINELGALMGLSQVQQPQFGASPQTGVAGVDYAGLVQQDYQGKLQSHNAMMGGLFGLLGAGLGAFSDVRLKEDIRSVGETAGGAPVYEYRYKWEPRGTRHIGVMAQDLIAIGQGDAVIMDKSGFLKVDYSRVH